MTQRLPPASGLRPPAFIGDTYPRRGEVFADKAWLFEYPVNITECTYIDDKSFECGYCACTDLLD